MDVNELKRRACEAVDRNAEKIIAVGESIFAEPELGYKEFKTSAKVKKVLDELGIAHQDDVAITGGHRAHERPQFQREAGPDG